MADYTLSLHDALPIWKFLVIPQGMSAEVTHYQGKDWIQLTE
ncbi:hypothetical protein [Escherichia coli]